MSAIAVPPPLNAPLRFATEAQAHGDLVRLGALADLSVLPAALGREVADLPVLRISRDRNEIVVKAKVLRARVAALAPELKPWLAEQEGAVRIRYDRPTTDVSRPEACVKVVGAAPTDGVVSFRNVVAAPCAAGALDGLWFDRASGVMRARRALAPGEIVRSPPASALAAIAPGDSLVIEARVGPVRVQRRVEALQPARQGEGLFVRTADGAVVSIPAPTEAP